MIYCYDIEVYRNFFCVTFKEVNTGEVLYFEISEWQKDYLSLKQFINNNKHWFIGYNSHYYDNQILNFIHKSNYLQNWLDDVKISINLDLYNLSQDIIQNDLRIYKYNLPFRDIDLMEVGGLSMKPLKLAAVNLNWPLIQDLPIPFDSYIKEENRELIRKYNLNDTEITLALYNFLLPEIKLRKEVSQIYNVNVMNQSDSHMANKLLEKFYSESTGQSIYDFKQLRTPRDFIHFGDVIFKNIKFETPELKSFLDKLRSKVIIKDKTYFKHSLIYRGLKLSLGMGGIHSDDLPCLFKETDAHYIIDADIGSFYPSLLIKHQLCPEHLSNKFIQKYSQIREERLEAKKNKELSKAEGLKTVLNSSWGKYNNEHFWLYDPLQAYRITVNGQLYILTLIEQLILNNFEVISCNTDGITCKVRKDQVNIYYNICRNWEIKTNFELEYSFYKIYARKDVNNYICQYDTGKLKEKGDFITSNLTKTNNTKLKGVDKKIIAIALQEYFINNKSIKDTIISHTNIYDFCTAIRTDPKFTTEFHYLKDNNLQIDIMQKTNRYYISKKGGKLLKWKLDKKNEKQYIDYCVGRQITIFNNYIEKPMNEYDIDYGYYISETQKIIDLIIPKQLTLF